MEVHCTMRDALVEWSPAFAAGGMLILLGILVGRYPGVFWAFFFVTFFGAIAAEILTQSLRREIAENSDKIQFLIRQLGLEEEYKTSLDRKRSWTT